MNKRSAPAGDEPFPATRPELLRQAAANDWSQFLAAYFRPCWREVELVCRRKGVAISDADDLFQELLVRLVRPGRIKRLTPVEENGRANHGNLPARYLMGIERGISTARFRTFLQQTIINLVREHLRSRGRRREKQMDHALEELLPCVEQTITQSLDRQSIASALAQAAESLRSEALQASTRAIRRRYAVLHAAIAERKSADEIARQFGLGRSTVAGILSAARARFVSILQARTEIDDSAELKRAIQRNPEALLFAFERLPP